MKDIAEEVQKVLSNQGDVQFEEIADETTSPLNQPVIEKDIGGTLKPKTETEEIETSSDTITEEKNEFDFHESARTLDAPEQQIDDEYQDVDQVSESEPGIELPEGHARQAADSLLGMSDNLLAVGGGFFVKIKKHKEFYDFDEIVQVIEEQNDKNVSRIKLDEEDKILLRPLLITILKKRAKKLTPEQQLMGAFISIMVKKAQAVMEIRAENEILTERILDIIREERGITSEEEESPVDDEIDDLDEPVQEELHEEPLEEYEEIITIPSESQTLSPESVLEVAEDVETTEKK